MTTGINRQTVSYFQQSKNIYFSAFNINKLTGHILELVFNILTCNQHNFEHGFFPLNDISQHPEHDHDHDHRHDHVQHDRCDPNLEQDGQHLTGVVGLGKGDIFWHRFIKELAQWAPTFSHIKYL